MTIRDIFRDNRKQFILYLFGILIIAPSNIMSSYALANAFNLFEASTTQEVIKVIGLSFLLALLPVFMQVISRYLRIGFMRDVLIEVRLIAYEKMMSYSVSEFSKKPNEYFQSELISDINMFENEFFLSLLNIIYSFGNFILGVIILLFISPLLALLTILISFVLYGVTKFFENPTLESRKKVLEANTVFHKSLTNIINGFETIKLYRVKDKFERLFYEDVYELEKNKRKNNQLNFVQSNISNWIAGSFQTVSVLIATILFAKKQIALSSLILVLNMMGQLVWSMNHSFARINSLKSSIETFNKIADIPKVEEKLDFNFKNQIVVENLNINYDDKNIISDLSLKINKNSKVLILGPSGSGKTSLINTLIKNNEDYNGNIFYDDVELRNIDYRSIVSKIGYVKQEHFLFDESISYNIVLNKEYDKEKLDQILKAVDLYDWIQSLDKKVEHQLINNASNISGGQRQRVSIARELYQNKEMIIFDEPSSSLDDETSNKIYQTLLNLNKTIIVVSHRHSEYLSDKFDMTIIFDDKGGIRVEEI